MVEDVGLTKCSRRNTSLTLAIFYPQVSLSNSAELEEIKKEKAEKKEKFGS